MGGAAGQKKSKLIGTSDGFKREYEFEEVNSRTRFPIHSVWSWPFSALCERRCQPLPEASRYSRAHPAPVGKTTQTDVH